MLVRLAYCASQLVGRQVPAEVRVVGQMPITAAPPAGTASLGGTTAAAEVATG